MTGIYNDGTAPGFSFPSDNTSLTIFAGELYGATRGDGITSNHSGNTLTNSGNVLSGLGNAISFLGGDDNKVINNADGSIIGQFTGIYLNGDHDTVDNSGTVMGLTGYGVILGAASLTNRGVIFGSIYAIVAGGIPGGGSIDNFGLIRSDIDGIAIGSSSGITTVSNEAGGVIRGTATSVHSSSAGAVQLVNAGVLQGNVVLASSQSDAVINRAGGIIQGNVNLGSGNDTYNALGGGQVIGTIFGEAGTDTFTAGRAPEAFNGGADADSFVFRSAAFSPVGASHDIIQAFIATGTGHDHIDVSAMDADTTHAGLQHFTFIGTDTFAHYHSLHPTVIGMLRFDAASHTLQGNVNGNFSNAEFAIGLPGVSTFGGSDLILA